MVSFSGLERIKNSISFNPRNKTIQNAKNINIADDKTVEKFKKVFIKNVLYQWHEPMIKPNDHVETARLYKVKKEYSTTGDLMVLLFFITGNRFCMRVKRNHKSNNIFFVLDLTDQSYHQRCLDPDCAWYCSPKYYLAA